MMYKLYGYKGKDLAEAMRKSEHAEMFTDVVFHHGLLMEDLRYFYVSLSELGKALGIPTPVTDSVLTVMSVMTGIDYRDGATTLPTDYQLKRLETLLEALCRKFGISADSVYLPSDCQ